MGGDSLDPTKLAPVCAQVDETTCHRLARADVRERLAALGARAPSRQRPVAGLVADGQRPGLHDERADAEPGRGARR